MRLADFKLAAKQKRFLKRQLFEKERKTQSEEATATCSQVHVVPISSSSSSGTDLNAIKPQQVLYKRLVFLTTLRPRAAYAALGSFGTASKRVISRASLLWQGVISRKILLPLQWKA